MQRNRTSTILRTKATLDSYADIRQSIARSTKEAKSIGLGTPKSIFTFIALVKDRTAAKLGIIANTTILTRTGHAVARSTKQLFIQRIVVIRSVAKDRFIWVFLCL